MSDHHLSRRRMLGLLGGAGALTGCRGMSSDDPDDTTVESDRTRSESPTAVQSTDRTRSEAPTTRAETADTNTESEASESETTAEEIRDTIYVSPDGDDSNSGTEDEPMETILSALDTVEPGQTVYLKPGEYRGRVVTITPGEPENPITITGSSDAVIRPSRAVDEDYYYPIKIQHSHYRLTGVTITGLIDPTAPEQVDSYTTRLLQVSARPESSTYIQDVVIAPHGIGNSQEKLISVVRVKDSEFGPFKVIGPAGVQYLYGDAVSHIGEILYIGQPLQVYADGADGYFWDTYDQTRNIHIHHIDNSEGYHHAELVDCKDGTRNITVEYCTDAGGSQNNEPFSAQSIHVRGHDCTFRWNRLAGGEGNGIEVYKPGSDELYPEFGFDQQVVDRIATDNEMYGNQISDFGGKAIAFDEDTRDAQQHVCGNDIDGSTNGNPEQECPAKLPAGDGIGHTGGDSPYT